MLAHLETPSTPATGAFSLAGVGRRHGILLASRLLAELAAEDDFDRAIAGSTDELAKLAAEALAEHRAGLTVELDPDRL
jgi:hypothetical protein